MQQLLDYYEGDNERVGFVLSDGSIVEVKNICHDPKNGFEVSGEDILKFHQDAVATWHTHPGAQSNLSVGDHDTYKMWPDLLHYIIGKDGISTYKVVNGKVVKDDQD